MKHITCLLLALCMALCLAACGETEPPAQPEVTNTPLPMRTPVETPVPPAETPEPVIEPMAAFDETTAVGNLLIHYPGDAEFAWDFSSKTISLTPFEDKSAFIQFSARSQKSAGWSFDEMMENGSMPEIIDGIKAELRTKEVLDEGSVEMLGVKAYYIYHAHEASGSMGYSKHYMLSDDAYNYQIFTFTNEAQRAQYEPAIDEIIAGLSWGQLDHKIYADNYVTFDYPLRYLEWSSSSAAGTDVLEELMKLVPENKSEDWVSSLESFLVAFYDAEGADAAYVPRIHVRMLDVPDATKETLREPAVLQGIMDQLNAEYPDGTWHREMTLEQHGDKTFAVGILEVPDGKGFVMYHATYVWEDRMVVFVQATPVELFDDHVIAEMEALLASLRIA